MKVKMGAKLTVLFLAFGLTFGQADLQTYAMEADVQNATTSEGQAATEYGIGNPIHHCSAEGGTQDYSTWSSVYFGHKIGSDVDSHTPLFEELSAYCIETYGAKEVSYVIQYEGKRYIVYPDIYVDSETDNIEYHLSFESIDENSPIEWRVLSVEGNRALLLSKSSFGYSHVQDWQAPGFSWPASVGRSYYNGYGPDENTMGRDFREANFLNSCFDDDERSAIQSYEYCEEGVDCEDKVFWLSQKDFMNPDYGFCSSKSDSASRSALVEDLGLESVTLGFISTRSKADLNNPYSLMLFSYDGRFLSAEGEDGFDDELANLSQIVPALYLDLDSDVWSIASTNLDDEPDEKPQVKPSSTPVPSKPSPSQPAKATGIAISGSLQKVAAGKSVQLSAATVPANIASKNVKWTSSNAMFATVSQTGLVTTTKAGAGKSVVITATVDGISDSYTIKIQKNAVTKIKLSAKTKSVKAGKSVKIKANVKTNGKNANKKLTFTSSNEKYATVSSSGTVKTKKAGKGKSVTITAWSTDGTNKKAKIKISIK